MGEQTLTERVSLMRRASAAIRKEWSARPGSAWDHLRDYHLAMADWLDGEAMTLGNMEPLVELFNAAFENESGIVGYLQFARNEAGEVVFKSDTSPAAVRMAEAYLAGVSA